MWERLESIVGVVLQKSEEVEVLKLVGAMDACESSQLKKLLLEVLHSGKRIGVDMEAMTYLDITCIQLLYALQQEAQRTGTSLELLAGPREEVLQTLKDVGMGGVWFAAARGAGGRG
ncbi:MAG TPA: STAS domain-containing protein [Terracidiphilus sp.]|nr:STAS domain-containing protein [Terracidiphilus sp.]